MKSVELAPAAVQILLVGDADPAKLNGAIRFDCRNHALTLLCSIAPRNSKRLQIRINQRDGQAKAAVAWRAV
jgi:hypothetical protein